MGKGGNAMEANHYKTLFAGYDVVGLITMQTIRGMARNLKSFFTDIGNGMIQLF